MLVCKSAALLATLKVLVIYTIYMCFINRIYDSKYWKENCFALTAELLVDKVRYRCSSTLGTYFYLSSLVFNF